MPAIACELYLHQGQSHAAQRALAEVLDPGPSGIYYGVQVALAPAKSSAQPAASNGTLDSFSNGAWSSSRNGMTGSVGALLGNTPFDTANSLDTGAPAPQAPQAPFSAAAGSLESLIQVQFRSWGWASANFWMKGC